MMKFKMYRKLSSTEALRLEATSCTRDIHVKRYKHTVTNAYIVIKQTQNSIFLQPTERIVHHSFSLETLLDYISCMFFVSFIFSKAPDNIETSHMILVSTEQLCNIKTWGNQFS